MDTLFKKAEQPTQRATLTFPNGDKYKGRVTFGGDSKMFTELYDGFSFAFEDLERVQASVRNAIDEHDEDYTLDEHYTRLQESTYFALNEGLISMPGDAKRTSIYLDKGDATFDLEPLDGDSDELHYIQHYIVGKLDALGSLNLPEIAIVSSQLEALAIANAVPNATYLPLDPEKAEDEGFDPYALEAESSVTKAALKVAYADTVETHGLSFHKPLSKIWNTFANHIDSDLKNDAFSSDDIKEIFIKAFQKESAGLSDDEIRNFDIERYADWQWGAKNLVDLLQTLPASLFYEMDNRLTQKVTAPYLFSKGETAPTNEIASLYPDAVLGELYKTESVDIVLDGQRRNFDLIVVQTSDYNLESAAINKRENSILTAIEHHNDGTSTVFTPTDINVFVPLTQIQAHTITPDAPQNGPGNEPRQGRRL